MFSDPQRRNKLCFLILFFPLPNSKERAGVARSVVCLGKWSLLLEDLGMIEHLSRIIMTVHPSWCPSPADGAGKELIMRSGKCVTMLLQNVLSQDVSCSLEMLSWGRVSCSIIPQRCSPEDQYPCSIFPPGILSWRPASHPASSPQIFSKTSWFGGSGFGGGELAVYQVRPPGTSWLGGVMC